MSKVLIGIYENKIMIMDMDTSKKAKRQAISEGADSVFVCEYTEDIRKAWLDGTEVNLSMLIG